MWIKNNFGLLFLSHYVLYFKKILVIFPYIITLKFVFKCAFVFGCMNPLLLDLFYFGILFLLYDFEGERQLGDLGG